ncbi:hypothetical protein HK405_012915, partial [Cladochytrium tenue]
RLDAFEALEDIEAELAAYRARLYQEKREELDREARLVHDGVHSALAPIMEQIRTRRDEQLSFATALLKFRESCFDESLAVAVSLADAEYRRKRASIRQEMVSECLQTQAALQEEFRRHHVPG